MTDIPKIGDNVGVPYAEGVLDRLELDYGQLLDNAKDTLSDADELPSTVESAIDVSAVAGIVVKLRDLVARGESHRVAEKEPYLRAGNAVQTFFSKRVIEPLDAKRKELTRRIDVFKQRQLAEERARREAEAAAARKAMYEAEKLRQEAEAKARRARSAENIEAQKKEAARAKIEAEMAAAKAEETHLATMASSSSLVGERFEGDRSGMVGMRKVPVVFIDDVSKLDLEALRPYLKEEALLSALRAWAKATNYSREMAGATVGMRDATNVR